MSTTEISAKVVMQLRASTGLPMMKCKEALEACGGDFEKAVEWLRKKGLETAAKKADRVMKEGRVALRTAPDGSRGVMVQLDCETEPVSGGPDFKGLVDGVLEIAWSKGPSGATLEDVLQSRLPSGETVDTTVKQLVARIGENLQVRAVAAFGGRGRLGSYLHFNHRVGVLLPEMPFEESFDVIAAFDVLEHVPELGKALLTVKERLVSGGHFIFVVPVHHGPTAPLINALDKDNTHIHRRPPRFWLDWAEAHFRIDRWWGIYRYMSPFGYLDRPTRLLRGCSPAIAVVARKS